MSNTELIRSFLASQKLAVISTSSPNSKYAESALIAFAEDQELNLYFQTGSFTRKANNISLNVCVSFVIGLDDTGITLQYQGLAEEIIINNDITACKKLFINKKSPTTRDFLDRPDVKFFKVRPNWISYSNYTKIKPEVFELNLY